MMCYMCQGSLEKLALFFALILAGSIIGVKASSGDYFPYDDEDDCSEDEYLCRVSGICIPETWLCDGDNDCGYLEDEAESVCGFLATCPHGCYNGATCSYPGMCTCTVGWSGSSCTIPLCPAGCLNGGNCSSPGICTCPTGWTGKRCRRDINECAGDHGCHHLCNNTDGSFHCYCNPGYVLDSNGTTCTDINECLVDNGGCEFSCTNLEGISSTTGLGYQCGCDNGYQLDPNNHDCSARDINQCAGDHGCDHLCNNTDGSFHCYCNPGYMLHSNGTTCTDINECLVDNGGCEFFCTNLEGINNTTGLGYQCGCDNGHQLAPNNHNCSDINECAGDHGCHHLCNNTDGSFHCYCNPGYMLHSNGTTCTDINECLIDNGGCEFSCTNLESISNTTGLGYQCGCDNGYQLAPNNHDCSDVAIDESEISDDSFSTEATIAISVVVAFIVIIILIITTMIIITSLYCKYQRELKKKYEADNSDINNESINTKQKDSCGDSITMVHYETVNDTNGPATTVEAVTDLGNRIAITVDKVETASNYYETMTTDETEIDPASGSQHIVNAMHTETAPKTADPSSSKMDNDPAYAAVTHPANKMHTDSVYISATTSACLHT